MTGPILITDDKILNKIYLIRNTKVMLDKDLSELYGVETKVLNQAVKRHIKRFPKDFMFQLSEEEFYSLRSQFVTLENKKGKGRHSKFLPHVFTEQGVAMLSSILNSDTAIEVNIQIIRIFTRIREIASSNNEILLKLEHIENTLIKQKDKINQHDEDIVVIFKYLKKLLTHKEEVRESIGYKSKATQNKK